MPPLTWLALGVAILLGAAPAGPRNRVAQLASAGRLVGPDESDSAPRRSAALSWPVASVIVGMTGSAAAAVLVGPAIGAAAAIVVIAVRALARQVVSRRALAARRAQLRTAVDVLIGELEAGARPTSALQAAGSAAPLYEDVFGRAAQRAARADDAAVSLVELPDTAALGHAWRLGEDTGAALAGVLRRVADDLKAAEAQRQAAAVALSGPRSSAAVLAGLPVLGVGLGVAMGARPGQFLFGSGIGQLVCCCGLLLDVAGIAWMSRILRRAELAP